MLFANFIRRSGAQFIAGLAIMFNAVFPAQAADTAKPFNRPLLFEPNRGQAASEVKWLARGPDINCFSRATPSLLRFPIARWRRLKARHRRRDRCCRGFHSPAPLNRA